MYQEEKHMELIQIPAVRRDRTGQLVPITAPPAKLLLHHLLLMKEADFYTQWAQPPKKISIRVNRMALDEPLINDIFFCYQQEVDNHKELGTPILNPNPKDAICGYIFNCYSYPEDKDDDIIVPAGFIIEEPDAILKKKLRRINQKIEDRAAQNKTIEKDDLMEQYQNYLLSQHIDPDSREYAEKCVDYWEELGNRRNSLEGCPPSRSKEIVLTTNHKEYNIKSLRYKFRYLMNTQPEWTLEWQMQHPLTDLSTKEGRMKLIVDWDKEAYPTQNLNKEDDVDDTTGD